MRSPENILTSRRLTAYHIRYEWFLPRILSKTQPDYHWQNGIIRLQKQAFIPSMSLLQLSTRITMTYLTFISTGLQTLLLNPSMRKLNCLGLTWGELWIRISFFLGLLNLYAYPSLNIYCPTHSSILSLILLSLYHHISAINQSNFRGQFKIDPSSLYAPYFLFILFVSFGRVSKKSHNDIYIPKDTILSIARIVILSKKQFIFSIFIIFA